MVGKRREGEKVIQVRKAADKARCAWGAVKALSGEGARRRGWI